MSKKRIINAVIAVSILVALSLNAACDNTGWALVGEIFGWSIIVGVSFLAVDNHIKEMEA